MVIRRTKPNKTIMRRRTVPKPKPEYIPGDVVTYIDKNHSYRTGIIAQILKRDSYVVIHDARKIVPSMPVRRVRIKQTQITRKEKHVPLNPVPENELTAGGFRRTR